MGVHPPSVGLPPEGLPLWLPILSSRRPKTNWGTCLAMYNTICEFDHCICRFCLMLFLSFLNHCSCSLKDFERMAQITIHKLCEKIEWFCKINWSNENKLLQIFTKIPLQNFWDLTFIVNYLCLLSSSVTVRASLPTATEYCCHSWLSFFLFCDKSLKYLCIQSSTVWRHLKIHLQNLAAIIFAAPTILPKRSPLPNSSSVKNRIPNMSPWSKRSDCTEIFGTTL